MMVHGTPTQGRTIGRYLLCDEIGRGSMATVHIGRSCGGPLVKCSDDSAPPGNYRSHVWAMLAPGTYYLAVNGCRGSCGSCPLGKACDDPSARARTRRPAITTSRFARPRARRRNTAARTALATRPPIRVPTSRGQGPARERDPVRHAEREPLFVHGGGELRRRHGPPQAAPIHRGGGQASEDISGGGGCGCRQAPTSSSSGAIVGGLFLMLLVKRRRSRRQWAIE
jgi:hypothetical protein